MKEQDQQQHTIPDIFANIPAILGYYPQESLAILLFREELTLNEQILTSHDPNTQLYTSTLHLDRVLGTDLNNLKNTTQALKSLPQVIQRYAAQQRLKTPTSDSTAIALALIISEQHSPTSDHAQKLVQQLASNPEHLIEAIYHVPSISTGETLTRLYSANHPASHLTTSINIPEHAQLTEITRSKSFQEKFRDHSEIPAITREALAGTFYPDSSEDDLANAHALNDRRGLLAQAIKEHERTIHSVQTAKYLENQIKQGQEHGKKYKPLQLHRANLLLRHARMNLQRVENLGLGLKDLSAGKRDSLIIKTMSMLITSQDRDLIIGPVLEHPNAAMKLFQAVAQQSYLSTDAQTPVEDYEPLTDTGIPPVRANALALYAIAAISADRNDKALIALSVAEKDHPSHSLSGLLLNATRQGVPPEEILKVVASGSRETLAELERHAQEGFTENPIADPYSDDEVQF